MIKVTGSKQVTIAAEFGPFAGRMIVIDDILPEASLESNKRVFAGQLIGLAGKSSCQPNSIHVAVLAKSEVCPDSEILDPSAFLGRLEFPHLTWVQECDEYRFIVMDYTVASGKLSDAVKRISRSVKRLSGNVFRKLGDKIKQKLSKDKSTNNVMPDNMEDETGSLLNAASRTRAEVKEILKSINKFLTNFRSKSTLKDTFGNEEVNAAFEKIFPAPAIEFPLYEGLFEEDLL